MLTLAADGNVQQQVEPGVKRPLVHAGLGGFRERKVQLAVDRRLDPVWQPVHGIRVEQRVDVLDHGVLADLRANAVVVGLGRATERWSGNVAERRAQTRVL